MTNKIIYGKTGVGMSYKTKLDLINNDFFDLSKIKFKKYEYGSYIRSKYLN